MPDVQSRLRRAASVDATEARAPETSAQSRLQCPLTGRAMVDPVVGPTGVSYEREALDAYQERTGHYPGMDIRVSATELYRDQFTRDLWPAGSDKAQLDALTQDPILMSAMTDPVTASDGRAYDLDTFLAIFIQHEGRSHFTRQPLLPIAYRHAGLRQRLGLGPSERPACTSTSSATTARSKATTSPYR